LIHVTRGSSCRKERAKIDSTVEQRRSSYTEPGRPLSCTVHASWFVSAIKTFIMKFAVLLLSTRAKQKIFRVDCGIDPPAGACTRGQDTCGGPTFVCRAAPPRPRSRGALEPTTSRRTTHRPSSSLEMSIVFPPKTRKILSTFYFVYYSISKLLSFFILLFIFNHLFYLKNKNYHSFYYDLF
jgi:hypothetical protein